MSDEAEREIFARVRGASRRSAPEDIAEELAALPLPRAASLGHSDLCDAFLQNLQRNGASATVAANRSEAVQEISRFVTGQQGQRRVVTGHDPRLAALPWRDGGLLPRFDVAKAEDSVSVSYARLGVAETGSLALWLDRNNPALNNLLIEDHVLLIDRHDIHLRLEDIWEDESLNDPRRRPRGIMMISGPSSTADISMELVLGAHGPRALHVIVVG